LLKFSEIISCKSKNIVKDNSEYLGVFYLLKWIFQKLINYLMNMCWNGQGTTVVLRLYLPHMVIPYPQARTHPPQVTLCSPAPQVVIPIQQPNMCHTAWWMHTLCCGPATTIGMPLDTPKCKVGPIKYGA